jgi:hypothetical protein
VRVSVMKNSVPWTTYRRASALVSLERPTS